MKLLMIPRTVFAVRSFAVRLVAPQRVAALLLALLSLSLPGRALAHKNGEASESCSCHGGGTAPTVMITPDLMTVNPGQLLTLTISISQTNGPVAGFFLDAGGVGTLKVVDSGTYLTGKGITHTTPRTGSGGFTTFKVGWMAPATPGGVDFGVYANSANGDGSPRGDSEGDAFYSTAFGCAGTKFYRDFDGDGVGAVTSGYITACSAPQYYSAKAGDCDENDPKVYPGAPEICDGKDNNCDGQVDEGLTFALYCADADGDGHGVIGKATMMACGVSKGWGLCDNDCNDKDPTIYPGAPELCNSKDDNCNGDVDEGARAVCGIGACAKYAAGCGAAAAQSCTPGAPRAEECNNFDDDCDGVADNGTDLELCKLPGLVCRNGSCIAAGSAGASSGGSSSGSGAAPSSSGSGGVSGGAASGPSQSAQAGNTGSQSATASPSGCSVGHSGTRPMFAGLGVLFGAAALLRRKQRRAASVQASARRQ